MSLTADLFQDLRYALRLLRKRPAFALVSVIALALGIGANAAVFSVVNALILNPLSFPELERLAEVRDVDAHQPQVARTATPADYLDWRERSKSFESLSAYTIHDFDLSAGGDPMGLSGSKVSVDFFDTLRAAPALGRPFRKGDDEPGNDQVVILSDTLWRHQFGADPTAVGRTILLDSKPFVIVGVMAPRFDFPLPGTALWSPLAFSAAGRADRRTHSLLTVGRLKEGVSLQAARSEMDSHARSLAREYPATNARRRAGVVELRERQGEFSKPFLILLQATAVFVLLIACANLANLQLAHGLGRRREIAVRTALGAERWRVMRLLLIENMTIAIAGGAAAVGVAYGAVSLLKTSVSPATARFIMGWNRVEVQPPVLLFTLVVAIGAGLAFGLFAAFQASRPQPAAVLKEGDAQGGARSFARTALVVSEVMLAVIAMMGASQMVRGFQQMFDVYQGFSPDRLLVVRIALPGDRYNNGAKRMAFYDDAIRELSTLPQVVSVTCSSNLPGALRFNGSGPVQIEGKRSLSASDAPIANFQAVGAGFFSSLRIPMRSGREMNDTDGPETPLVVVVSQAFASRNLPGENAVGKRILIQGSVGAQWRTIVGVAGDVNQFWFQKDPQPMVYLPQRQAPRGTMYIALRTTGDAMSVLPGVRDRLRSLDASLPLHDPKTMRDVMQETLSAMSLTTGMMTVFGFLALVLAAVGVYGVMAYTVTQRIREFGIRMALGANADAVLRLALWRGFRLTVIGCALGVAAGFGVSRLMEGLIVGASSTSIAVVGGVPLLLALVSLLACWLPARMVNRVDPAVVLRQQ